MWFAALGSIIKSNLPRILLIGGCLALFSGYTALIYHAGKNSVIASTVKETNKKAGEANEVKNNNKRLPDGAAARELRKHWSRK